MRRVVVVPVIWAALLLGCDNGASGVPVFPGPDAACVPMPVECENPMSCEVTVREDGARVCSGTGCCQSFCEANGCVSCCS